MDILASVYKAFETADHHPIRFILAAAAAGAAVAATTFGVFEAGSTITDLFNSHTASAPDGPMWDPGVINK